MRRLRISRDGEHPHGRQAAESAAYAPRHLATVYPTRFSPPPAKVTGALVADVFPGTRDPAALRKLGAGLQAEPAAESAAALEAELARMAAEAAAAKTGRVGAGAASSAAGAGAAAAKAAAGAAAKAAAGTKLR